MANNYYDGTGVLLFTSAETNKLTPVLLALFGPFNLDTSENPLQAQRYIAKLSEDNCTNWQQVLDGLQETINENPDDALLKALMVDVIEAAGDGVGQDAELSTLFELAQKHNDGHHLKAISFEGCWHCSKPRLFEFGGNGEYIDKHVVHYTSSGQAQSFGEALSGALERSDPPVITDLFMGELSRLLNSIKDEPLRKPVIGMLAARLLKEM